MYFFTQQLVLAMRVDKYFSLVIIIRNFIDTNKRNLQKLLLLVMKIIDKKCFQFFGITKYILSFHSLDTQQFRGMSTYFPRYLLSRVQVPVFQSTVVRSTNFPATRYQSRGVVDKLCAEAMPTI